VPTKAPQAEKKSTRYFSAVQNKLSTGGITFDQMQELIKNKDKKKKEFMYKKET